MAKQESIITLNGAIDNISFFKTKDGYNARKKTGVSADVIATDSRFARTRENMAEFKRAAKASKLLRDALLESTVGSKDRKMVPRLTKAMMKVLLADQTSERGKRNVIDGEAELLQGFEFNIYGTLSTTVLAPLTPSIDRATGSCKVVLPPYNAEKMIKKAEGATHYRFGITAASIDFEAETKETVSTFSGYQPVDQEITPLLEIEAMLPANSTHPIFLVLTIEFVQETNGRKYSLNAGDFNACALVKVEGGV